MAPHAIFFDVDGVLLDSLSIKGEAFAFAFRDFPEFRDQIIQLHLENAGLTRGRKCQRIFEAVLGIQPNPEQLAMRVQSVDTFLEHAMKSSPEIRGASTALSFWGVRVPLYAVSATPDGELKELFRMRGLYPLFTEVCGWPQGKSEVLRRVVTQEAYEATLCVMVGDSEVDLMAAQESGLRFIQVAASGQRRLHGTDYVIPDLTDLTQAVGAVLGATD